MALVQDVITACLYSLTPRITLEALRDALYKCSTYLLTYLLTLFQYHTGIVSHRKKAPLSLPPLIIAIL